MAHKKLCCKKPCTHIIYLTDCDDCTVYTIFKVSYVSIIKLNRLETYSTRFIVIGNLECSYYYVNNSMFGLIC